MIGVVVRQVTFVKIVKSFLGSMQPLPHCRANSFGRLKRHKSAGPVSIKCLIFLLLGDLLKTGYEIASKTVF